jgi:hypothetical protein
MDEDEGVSRKATNALVEGEWAYWDLEEWDGREVETSLLEELEGRELEFGTHVFNEIGYINPATSIELLIKVLLKSEEVDVGYELDNL